MKKKPNKAYLAYPYKNKQELGRKHFCYIILLLWQKLTETVPISLRVFYPV